MKPVQRGLPKLVYSKDYMLEDYDASGTTILHLFTFLGARFAIENFIN